MSAETCHFCGKPIVGSLGPDRDVTGRFSHWRCSTEPACRKEWVSAPVDSPDSPDDGNEVAGIDRAIDSLLPSEVRALARQWDLVTEPPMRWLRLHQPQNQGR
jgi:hypothetical protein